MVRVPENEWSADGRRPLSVWRSRAWQATLWLEAGGQLRLSINRPSLRAGIAWEELQAVKAAVGFGTWQGLEVYPPEGRVVNQANVRHLWLSHEPMKIGW
jgi:hypothetical protein